MTLFQAQDEYLVYLDSVRSVSPNTIAGYRNDLDRLCEFLGKDRDITGIKKNDFLICVGELSKEKKSAASINRFIAAVRGLFSYCRRMNYTSTNVALELKTVKLPKRIPRFLTGDEVDDICKMPGKQEILWETRDSAIFEMLYSSGCRVSELVGLKFQDFKDGTKSALVRGKGNKERYVYFEEDARKALALYLEDRKKRFPDSTESHIFLNQGGTALSVSGVQYILSKYSGPEGTNHHVSPHAFRHTFATSMIANGADVRLVQELLGHSRISTTQRYTHVTTERLIDIYNKAHPHGE
ncbi:MAG: tyrosine-type recombinase/integrase [Treponema sp.]|nr:tyrosine-type recombinase/integrase [Treponema sp.]